MDDKGSIVDLFGRDPQFPNKVHGPHCPDSERLLTSSPSPEQVNELIHEVAALRGILARLVAHVVSAHGLDALDDIVMGQGEMDLPLEQTAALAEFCLEAARAREELRL